MSALSDRSLRVALTGYIHDDDPHVIAEMQEATGLLSDALGKLIDRDLTYIDGEARGITHSQIIEARGVLARFKP